MSEIIRNSGIGPGFNNLLDNPPVNNAANGADGINAANEINNAPQNPAAPGQPASVLHTFTASDKNLAQAFADLLQGTRVPSEIQITNAETGQPDRKLHKALCSAAVRVATALMSTIPGKETTLGFRVGKFTAELTREATGKFFLSIEGAAGDNNPGADLQHTEISINDVANRFASRITDDVLAHPECYPATVEREAKEGEPQVQLGALGYLMTASDAGGQSPLNRNQLTAALLLRMRQKAERENCPPITEQELAGIGIKSLRHLAASSITDPNMTVASLRAKLETMARTDPIMNALNSAEAAKDMQMIQDLLDKNPNLVQQKADITNIGQVRTDPQQGMTPEQKAIHNLIADLFMPQDTSVYDNTAGQSGNRVRQLLAQHPDALKILLEASFNTGTLPLNSLPPKVAEQLKPVLSTLMNHLATAYSNSLKPEEQQALSQKIASGTFTISADAATALLSKLPLTIMADVDKAAARTADIMAKDQQQLITDKFTASLQRSAELKQNAASVPFWEKDLKAMVDGIVKTPRVTAEQEAQNPEAANTQKEQRYKEQVKAFQQIIATYREPLLAYKHINKAEENAMGYSVPMEYRTIRALLGPFDILLNVAGGNEPPSWFSDAGRAAVDNAVNNVTPEELKNMFSPDHLDRLMNILLADHLTDGQPDGKTNMQAEMQSYIKGDEFKSHSIDLTSKTLSQLDAEPDGFDKPGMGQLIKNVLTSYFSTEPMQPRLPQGISDELKTLAQTLAASKDADPKVPRNLSQQDAALVKQAITAYRQAADFNAKLPALLRHRAIDRRSMISSMIRYSDNTATQAAQLGAMLKGAGPLMHKLLQGLELPGMDPDFKTALDDMKSNLNPIDPKYVQAQMLKLVDSSEGRITSMSIKQPLGAASVGQAFLVTVTPADGEPYDTVLKIIRPDVQVKTQREFQQFMLEAEKIPGMADTYRGLYEQYRKEFDLKLEASNITLGQQAYNDGLDTDRVATMRLVQDIPPTETSMLIRQAPGDTLDRYIKQTHERILELQNSKPKTPDEILNVKLELKNLYLQLHDLNKSLGVTARKWLNTALFSPEGFFHGDMHPGNLIVRPGNPTLTNPQNPLAKAKITLIDYGNATKMTKDETNALRKVNVACSFGGLYQFEADAKQKPIVEKHTLKLFMDGFKALLPEGELKKFEASEKQLTEEVIKPILLKGSKTEVGVRMSLLIKKLQQAGIAIPGALSNMAESEKRLSNGIDSVNALMEEIDNALSDLPMPTTGGYDPAFKLIKLSTLSPLRKSAIQTVKRELNYDLQASQQVVDKWTKPDSFKIPDNATADETKIIEQDKKATKKAYLEFRAAESEQILVLRNIDTGFKHPVDEMWNHRPVYPNLTDNAQTVYANEMQLGMYLTEPHEADPLYGLHQQFLEARARLSPEILEDIFSSERTLTNDREEEKTLGEKTIARQHIAELKAGNPDVAEYLRLRQEIFNELRPRMFAALDKCYQKMPDGNPIRRDENLQHKEDLTTATIEVVSDKVQGETQAEATANAINFASESLGFSTWGLIFNKDDQKSYFKIIANKFMGEGADAADNADDDDDE